MGFRKKPLPERVRVRVRTKGGFSRGGGGGGGGVPRTFRKNFTKITL